ncbi:isoprenylcysteine carboxylmethyltransferase family protein [Mycolicibacterium sp. P9-64]|uniref:methyltransferase family protein n=1 Tax=Mycolicibacterium sp. P9-64 TaxID=2024612 RepID=UPI0011F013BC|nr:isoprenylcysteine carboxylmethyltransferase family protein [Mycolicibacterium sp. P9-64]KAA0080759.1 isoprenylcysteine carboxylmethyltransferase family protein [Mycolicibacterium sp. P9-64]
MKTALQVTTTSVLGLALMALTLFWPAGTVHYWQAWVFFGMFVGLSVIFTAYAGARNPEVLRRRLNAGPLHESRPVQKVVSAGVVLAFFALLVVSGLDRRFGWSDVPTALVVIGDVIAAVGLGIGMLVVAQNSYAAANITVEAEQTVVSTGLYGVVRHPMYFGVLVMAIGVPLALGSYWALLIVPIDAVLFAIRIVDEEKALAEELCGYRDYTETVHSRLVPGVW